MSTSQMIKWAKDLFPICRSITGEGIRKTLSYFEKLNPEFKGQFKVLLVPNITNICYGRGVGYKIEEIELSKEIQEISATKIRAKMREEGKLKQIKDEYKSYLLFKGYCQGHNK